MPEIAQLLCGLAAGYLVASFIESILHERVSDAPPSSVRLWRKHQRLCRALINTRYSHHVIHHHRTFRQDHVTQFQSEQERSRLDRVLAARGRHGRVIIGGDYANRLHGEGALVFCFPVILVGVLASCFLPAVFVLAMLPTLSFPPLLSYFVHPYLHKPFAIGQATAPRWLALLLRTRYMRAVYRNHFMHHEHGGTSNFNLLLGADILLGRAERPSADDVSEMCRVGIPVD